MMQVVEQTREERVKMYLRSTKKQLAEMLATRDVLQIDVYEAMAGRITWVDARPLLGWSSGHIDQSDT